MTRKKANEIEVIKKNEEKEMVSNEKRKPLGAFFIKRLVAYVLDVFLVSIVVSLVMFPIPQNKNLTKLNEEMLEVNESYLNEEIGTDEYINKSIGLSHDIAYNNVLFTIIDIVAIILYFIVFQFYNNGQTLGKKVLHIRVVKVDGSKLTMNDLVFRAFVVPSVLISIFELAFTIFASENIYFYGVNTLQIVQTVILVISMIMMSFRQDRRGLQDFIARTKVINEE